MWTLHYDPRVRKQLQKIKNKDVIRRIKESAERLQDAPYSGKPLKGYRGLRSNKDRNAARRISPHLPPN